jgi:hypothetical protein
VADMTDDLIKRSDVLSMIDAFERDFEQSWKAQFRADVDAIPAIKDNLIEQLERERDEALAAQPYTYIGKNMKPILARDLEDAKDAAEAKLAKVVDRLETMDDYNNYISYVIWATRNELGGKND